MQPSGEVKGRIDQLRAIRKRLRWSEEFCAYQLGVTYSTLNRWERGESLPRSRAVLSAVDRFIATYGNAQDAADTGPQTGGSQ